MMAQHIDDYAAIGQAFSADQEAVSASIQRLRAQAYNAGSLRNNSQQQVEVQQPAGQTIYVIQPVSPQVVYVPQYDPTIVYVRPSGAVVAASLITFGAAITITALMVDRPWGWGGWGWNWGLRRAYYNHIVWGGWSNPYRPPRPWYRPRPVVWANRPGYGFNGLVAKLRSAWTLRLRSGHAREGARPHTFRGVGFARLVWWRGLPRTTKQEVLRLLVRIVCPITARLRSEPPCYASIISEPCWASRQSCRRRSARRRLPRIANEWRSRSACRRARNGRRHGSRDPDLGSAGRARYPGHHRTRPHRRGFSRRASRRRVARPEGQSRRAQGSSHWTVFRQPSDYTRRTRPRGAAVVSRFDEPECGRYKARVGHRGSASFLMLRPPQDFKMLRWPRALPLQPPESLPQLPTRRFPPPLQGNATSAEAAVDRDF